MLGGSQQQVPVIKKAKELGYETILIDYLEDNPGQLVADKWYQESTTDVEKVLDIAIKEKVDGILAYASDPAALPAAIVAEKLGLPTNPAKSVEILGIKHKFRKFLKENSFPSPEIFTFNPDDDINEIKGNLQKLKFPIVIKPTDSSGSKGVSFLDDLSDLQRAIMHADEYSRNKILIAEEFIERGFPYVIGGDIFIENGEITLLGDMAALRENKGEGLIPVGEKFPNGLNVSQRKKVFKELQRLVDCLGIKNGELNIEILLDKEDYPHFLELGPRAGGNMIPVQLSDIFGIDLIEANIKVAMGEHVGLKPSQPKECFMTYVLHSDKDGLFKDIAFSPEIEKFIYRKVIYKKPGNKVEAFDGASKALGIIFLRFPKEQTMKDLLSKVSNHIEIKMASSK